MYMTYCQYLIPKSEEGESEAVMFTFQMAKASGNEHFAAHVETIVSDGWNWVKINGTFEEFADFKYQIRRSGIDLVTKKVKYIMDCKLISEGEWFYIVLDKQDLGNVNKFIKLFNTAIKNQNANALLVEDAFKNGKILQDMRNKLNRYVSKPNTLKEKWYVVSEPCFLYEKDEDQLYYILNGGTAIACGTDTKDIDATKINILWNGSNDDKSDVKSTDNIKRDFFSFLELLVDASQLNFPLLLALMSYTRLSMFRRDIYHAGKKLGNVFIIGKFHTGKSEAAEYLGKHQTDLFLLKLNNPYLPLSCDTDFLQTI